MSDTAERQQGDSKNAVTETAVAQIWIFRRVYGKTSATDLTTRWWSELGLVVASVTAMAAAGRQQQWRHELGLQDLATVATERWQKRQDKSNGRKTTLAYQQHGSGETSATVVG